jgi:hypothetical protein
MTRHAPRPGLWLALAATLLATAWVATEARQPEPPELVSPSVRPKAAGTPDRAAHPHAAVEWPQRVTRLPAPPWPPLSQAAAGSWGGALPPAPPPRPVAPAPTTPPAPPQAPAFPYQLIGRLEGADGLRALLTNDVRTLAVAVGAVVDGQWRVDKVDRNAMSVTWLPGEQARVVAYGTSR